MERRAELRRETMEAKVGEAAEVPPMETGSPERKMRKRSAWAATSGMACGDVEGCQSESVFRFGECQAMSSVEIWG